MYKLTLWQQFEKTKLTLWQQFGLEKTYLGCFSQGPVPYFLLDSVK